MKTGHDDLCYEFTRLHAELLTSHDFGVPSLGSQVVYESSPCSMRGSDQPSGSLKLNQVSVRFFSIFIVTNYAEICTHVVTQRSKGDLKRPLWLCAIVIGFSTQDTRGAQVGIT
jgi:hypothetical protein